MKRPPPSALQNPQSHLPLEGQHGMPFLHPLLQALLETTGCCSGLNVNVTQQNATLTFTTPCSPKRPGWEDLNLLKALKESRVNRISFEDHGTKRTFHPTLLHVQPSLEASLVRRGLRICLTLPTLEDMPSEHLRAHLEKHLLHARGWMPLELTLNGQTLPALNMSDFERFEISLGDVWWSFRNPGNPFGSGVQVLTQGIPRTVVLPGDSPFHRQGQVLLMVDAPQKTTSISEETLQELLEGLHQQAFECFQRHLEGHFEELPDHILAWTSFPWPEKLQDLNSVFHHHFLKAAGYHETHCLQVHWDGPPGNPIYLRSTSGMSRHVQKVFHPELANLLCALFFCDPHLGLPAVQDPQGAVACIETDPAPSVDPFIRPARSIHLEGEALPFYVLNELHVNRQTQPRLLEWLTHAPESQLKVLLSGILPRDPLKTQFYTLEGFDFQGYTENLTWRIRNALH